MSPGALVANAKSGVRIGPVALKKAGNATLAACDLVFPRAQIVENASAALVPFGVFVAQAAAADGSVAPVRVECDDGAPRTWPLPPTAKTSNDKPMKHDDARVPWGLEPWGRFPSFWFGENADAMDNATELALVGKFALAVYGWQHALGVAPKGRQEGQKLSAQCAALKATPGSRARCAVYRQGWLGMSNYDEQRAVIDTKASATAGWWLTDDAGAPDGHSGTPGGVPVSSVFWNFANASAAEYYQQKVVRPLAQDPHIDAVFFDDMPGACCNAEHNLPSHYTKQEALAICDATLANFRAVAQILNAGNKLPIFSMFQKPWQPCLLPQSTILAKLGSAIHYARFSQTVVLREGVPSSYGANCSQSIEDALAEVSTGLDYIQWEDVSTGAYKRDEQLNLSTAVFLLVRGSASTHSYYGSSSSWAESGWQWEPLYDQLGQLGKPLGPAQKNATGSADRWTREYEGGTVHVTCPLPGAAGECFGLKGGPCASGGVKFKTEVSSSAKP